MATIYFISAPIYPYILEEEKTRLTVASSASATSISVDNTDGFSANDYIIVGELGKEDAELAQISSVTNDTTLAVGALKFAHANNADVRRTPFNQIKFYYSSTATGTFAIDGSATAMQVDNKDLFTTHETTLTDARTQYWKITYYNSTSADETSLSDATATYGAKQFYCSVQDIYDSLDMVEDKINPNTISLAIESVTKDIDDRTNSSFVSNTTTDEYHDGKGSYDDEYFLHNRPILTITTLSTTQNVEGTASPTFTSLTVVTDYEVDLDTGRIAIVNSSYVPPEGRHRLKCTYTWGYSDVPENIRRLAITMTLKRLAKDERYSELILSNENVKETMYGFSDTDIENILGKYRQIAMENS